VYDYCNRTVDDIAVLQQKRCISML